jgi:hypothetical protein
VAERAVLFLRRPKRTLVALLQQLDYLIVFHILSSFFQDKSPFTYQVPNMPDLVSDFSKHFKFRILAQIGGRDFVQNNDRQTRKYTSLPLFYSNLS